MLNNGSSSTRVRWVGSSEMMDGNSVGIQVEYQEVAGGTPRTSPRQRQVQRRVRQGHHRPGLGGGRTAPRTREAWGTFGVGHGQEKGSAFALGDYFGSLDAGGRTHNIRYDSPALGPVGAAVSVGNGDRISAAATLSTEFSGSSFNAMVATLQATRRHVDHRRFGSGCPWRVDSASRAPGPRVTTISWARKPAPSIALRRRRRTLIPARSRRL